MCAFFQSPQQTQTYYYWLYFISLFFSIGISDSYDNRIHSPLSPSHSRIQAHTQSRTLPTIHRTCRSEICHGGKIKKATFFALPLFGRENQAVLCLKIGSPSGNFAASPRLSFTLIFTLTLFIHREVLSKHIKIYICPVWNRHDSHGVIYNFFPSQQYHPRSDFDCIEQSNNIAPR